MKGVVFVVLTIWGSTVFAQSSLVQKADALLKNARVYSVVDKRQIPPSGNKYAYMSQGSYWWPDTSKKDGEDLLYKGTKMYQ